MRGLLFVGLVFIVGCGDDGGSGSEPMCNQDPWSCPAGQTCWPTDAEGATFACLNSGPGEIGDPCSGTVGSPECGDALICNLLSVSERTCTAYCDPTAVEHACPGGAQCAAGRTYGGLDIQICESLESEGEGEEGEVSADVDAGR